MNVYEDDEEDAVKDKNLKAAEAAEAAEAAVAKIGIDADWALDARAALVPLLACPDVTVRGALEAAVYVADALRCARQARGGGRSAAEEMEQTLAKAKEMEPVIVDLIQKFVAALAPPVPGGKRRSPRSMSVVSEPPTCVHRMIAAECPVCARTPPGASS